MPDHSKILAYISGCEDATKLRSIFKNAQAHKEKSVADAAFRKLISLVPSERKGTVEYDFWQTVYAFEHILTEERERTTRLSRTRQKVSRVGVIETLKDWALSGQETDGFKMLLARAMPELTGEAIVIRHPECFEPHVIAAARDRLTNAGVDVGSLPVTAQS